MTVSASVRPTSLYKEYSDPSSVQENDLRRHLLIFSTDFSEALGVFKRFQTSIKHYIADALETQIPYDPDESIAPAKCYTYFLNPHLEPVKRIVDLAKTLFEKEILPRLDRQEITTEEAKKMSTRLAFLDKEREVLAIRLNTTTMDLEKIPERPEIRWTKADFLLGIQSVFTQIENELEMHGA